MKVLVVQQRYGIGDMLIFLPYLKALAEKNMVKISLLAKKTSRSSELFKAENFLDEIIDLDPTNDGISGIIDNKGTIVDILDKGKKGLLNGNVNLVDHQSIYLSLIHI